MTRTLIISTLLMLLPAVAGARTLAVLPLEQGAGSEEYAGLGQGLGAELVVTGSYSVVGETFLLDARVIEVESAAVLEAVDASGSIEDFVVVEKDLVEALLDGLEVEMSSSDSLWSPVHRHSTWPSDVSRHTPRPRRTRPRMCRRRGRRLGCPRRFRTGSARTPSTGPCRQRSGRTCGHSPCSPR